MSWLGDQADAEHMEYRLVLPGSVVHLHFHFGLKGSGLAETLGYVADVLSLAAPRSLLKTVQVTFRYAKWPEERPCPLWELSQEALRSLSDTHPHLESFRVRFDQISDKYLELRLQRLKTMLPSIPLDHLEIVRLSEQHASGEASLSEIVSYSSQVA